MSVLGYVVVGLSSPCQDDETLECVSWVHGPFTTSAEAREYAGTVPEGFRPHVLLLEAPMEGIGMATAATSGGGVSGPAPGELICIELTPRPPH